MESAQSDVGYLEVNAVFNVGTNGAADVAPSFFASAVACFF